MSSTLSSLGSVSKWFEDPCQNAATCNCFICQKLPPHCFSCGESLEFAYLFPCSIPVSPLWCLEHRSCPSSADTGDEFGECSPHPALIPAPGIPACPFAPSQQFQDWEEPKKGVLKEGS